MLFDSPLSGDKADHLVQLLQLRPGARVIDVGCGKGELLLRIVSHHDSHGVGVDRDPICVAAAQKNAAARDLTARCTFRELDANELEEEPGGFDLGICIGSTHALGSGESAYPNTVSQLSQYVRPGGYLLVGECYWKQTPAPEYLQLLGDPVGIYRDHAGNVAFAESLGLIPLYALTSSEDEWDQFEWGLAMKIQLSAEATPDDPVTSGRLARNRRWRDGYLRWGRSTMGFGLYLFRVAGGQNCN